MDSVDKFMDALKTGDLQVLDKLIQQGKSLLHCGFHPTKGILKHRALTFAAEKGNLKVIRFLVAAGIDVNQKNGCDETGLHYAARLPDPSIINLLVTNGADVNIKDSRGLSPLHWALEAENMDNAKTLIANRAKLFVNKVEEERIRKWAIEHKIEEMLNILVDFQQIGKNMHLNKYSGLDGEELQLLKDQNDMKLEKLNSKKMAIKREYSEATDNMNFKIRAITADRITIIREMDEIQRKIQLLKEEERGKETEIQESHATERRVEEHTANNLKGLSSEMMILEDKIDKCMHNSKMMHYELAKKGGTSKSTSSTNKELVEFLQDQIKTLEDELKCPVCLKVSEVPIYTCSLQHHVCGSCFSSLFQVYAPMIMCPTCREYMNLPPSRHRSMEKMAEQLHKLHEKLNQL